jgi:3-hydroxybutyryl-CoA dehydratase
VTGLKVGDVLPVVRKRVTQEQVGRYADASGDHNPLHLDAEFAAKTAFKRPIAHGMLTLAFVMELLTQAFGRSFLEGGRLRVRFKGPVYPGDDVAAESKVNRETVEQGRRYLECAVVLKNPGGEDVVTGTALVPLP